MQLICIVFSSKKKPKKNPYLIAFGLALGFCALAALIVPLTVLFVLSATTIPGNIIADSQVNKTEDEFLYSSLFPCVYREIFTFNQSE